MTQLFVQHSFKLLTDETKKLKICTITLTLVLHLLSFVKTSTILFPRNLILRSLFDFEIGLTMPINEVSH